MPSIIPQHPSYTSTPFFLSFFLSFLFLLSFFLAFFFTAILTTTAADFLRICAIDVPADVEERLR